VAVNIRMPMGTQTSADPVRGNFLSEATFLRQRAEQAYFVADNRCIILYYFSFFEEVGYENPVTKARIHPRRASGGDCNHRYPGSPFIARFGHRA
jgi:hypothetical protein